jgi:hypothetical protein
MGFGIFDFSSFDQVQEPVEDSNTNSNDFGGFEDFGWDTFDDVNKNQDVR